MRVVAASRRPAASVRRPAWLGADGRGAREGHRAPPLRDGPHAGCRSSIVGRFEGFEGASSRRFARTCLASRGCCRLLHILDTRQAGSALGPLELMVAVTRLDDSIPLHLFFRPRSAARRAGSEGRLHSLPTMARSAGRTETGLHLSMRSLCRELPSGELNAGRLIREPIRTRRFRSQYYFFLNRLVH